ncbi:Uncharacterised protein [Mycobacteroides abscessus subsp. abscessus]|nr:Uncharacterised protein [Mycobacteroides abscessus subsp. abscessus]
MFLDESVFGGRHIVSLFSAVQFRWVTSLSGVIAGGGGQKNPWALVP